MGANTVTDNDNTVIAKGLAVLKGRERHQKRSKSTVGPGTAVLFNSWGAHLWLVLPTLPSTSGLFSSGSENFSFTQVSIHLFFILFGENELQPALSGDYYVMTVTVGNPTFPSQSMFSSVNRQSWGLWKALVHLKQRYWKSRAQCPQSWFHLKLLFLV